MASSQSYKVPPAFTVSKSYNRWIEEIKVWQALTELEKKKQGLAIALSLPEEGQNSVRDKVFSEISANVLNADDGVTKLIEFLDKIFKKDELSEAYETYVEFDRFRRSKVSSMEDYVIEFEKLYNKTKKFKMELPQPVLAFKLLECSDLEMKDRQLVLTGVDYEKTDTLFKQMSISLKKFFGQQAASSKEMTDVSGIKVESVNMMSEDVNYARNRFASFRGSQNYRGNTVNRGNRGRGNFRGNFNRGRGFGGSYTESFSNPKPVNPDGPDGQPLRCLSCDSVRHLVKQCPHSYENMARQKVEKAVLFTGNKPQETLVLLAESANSAVLDSACTSTVAGEIWMNCYMDSLDPTIRDKVVEQSSDTMFKFGGGTVLKSNRKMIFPCSVAGVDCEIEADVVDSDIPLLLSKDSMKKAKMKLDLENDSASIFGKEVQLQCTSSGHYCVPIDQVKVNVEETSSVLMSTQQSKDKMSVIEKLHKQFAHPTAKRLKSLLEDAGGYTEEHLKCVDKVTECCEICKRYKKAPARPVVSLPLASEFNEVVAVDLEEWKHNVYFLHMIDLATRFSLASVIRRKTPDVIAEKIMTMWIGSGMGPPKRFLADNGGEFANETFRDMCENLNIEVMNTAAYSPWQNGVCERNHAVVDDCVEKILEGQPNLNLDVALVWAVNAKNSLSMVYGWSPYQLVYGSNPNLPGVLTDKPPALENTTISEKFARHLNALHSSRRAFVQAESSERIRRALRHKIRTSGEYYQHGDRVYYKRDDDHRWKGPGIVIGQDGKVVFVRHGSMYVRVPPCRLIRCGSEFSTERVDNNQKTATSNYNNECDFDSSDDNETENETNAGNAEVEIHVDEVQPELDQRPAAPAVVRPKVKPEIPSVGDQIMYRDKGSASWLKAKVMSRGGKATGKNWAYLNIQDENKDIPLGKDFVKDVDEWHNYDSEEEVNVVHVPMSRHEEENVKCAKEVELENWSKFGVYEEIPKDNQRLMSTRWVVTEKMTENGRITKARLVVRGFEEESNVKSDSPTVHKESLRLFLSVASTQGYKVHSIDIKAAFLQGKNIDRDIFVQPPKESGLDNSVAWKLNKCVYGLVDASRNWFLSVKNELIQLKCEQSKLDPALFYWFHEGKLEGLFLMHVDDFLWAGSELFNVTIISPLRKKFCFGKESDSRFRYIGLHIEQTKGEIYIHQQDYIDELKQVNMKTDSRSMNDQIYPEAVGQLHWIATQTRPDICYDVLDLATASHLCVSKLQSKVNKVIRKSKSIQYKLAFPSLGSLEDSELLLFTDASYANLSDKVSSAGGYIIFLKGSNGRLCPISWASKKIKRVVKSTLAAEALALVEGLDACYFVKSILQEMIKVKNEHRIPIKCYTDNKSLSENIHSTKLISEKRLRLDLASIKESVNAGDIEVIWVRTSKQISDCLTKAGADFRNLVEVLSGGNGL